MSLLKATRPSGTSHRGQHRHRRAELVNVLEACRFLVCGEGWGGEGLRCWALRFQHRELQATHTKDGRHTKSQTCDAVSAAVVCCLTGLTVLLWGGMLGLAFARTTRFQNKNKENTHRKGSEITQACWSTLGEQWLPCVTLHWPLQRAAQARVTEPHM